MSISIPLHRRFPRLITFISLALALLIVIAILSPAQLPISLYKLSLVTLAAVVGYWLDRALFPYARPDGYLVRDWRCGACRDAAAVPFPIQQEYLQAFIGACTRRAIVVAAVILGVSLGL